MTWSDLRAMRMAGKCPSLPVIVTTRGDLARAKEGSGEVVILHRSGEVMPVELLEGLDVRFAFGFCFMARPVYELMATKEVHPASVQTWCDCLSAATTCLHKCDRVFGLMEWLEEPRAQ